MLFFFFFFFQAEDGIRDYKVTGVQTCALPIWKNTIARFHRWQQDQLAILHETRNEHRFVATLFFMKNLKAKTSFSVCAWQSHFTDTLLPKADAILFAIQHASKEEEFLALCPWDKVVNICGDLMLPQGMYPELIRVTQFPSEKQLAELKNYDIS